MPMLPSFSAVNWVRRKSPWSAVVSIIAAFCSFMEVASVMSNLYSVASGMF